MRKKRTDDLLKLAFVAPMADIGFLLIIFFIVTSDLERDATDEQIILPTVRHDKPIRLKRADQLTINVRKNGDMTVSGEPITREDLALLVGEIQKKWGTAYAVIIRGDRETEFSQTNQIVKILGKSGFTNVSFCVEIAGKQ